MHRSSILIASASTGTGHLRAGEALREALLERDPTARIEHVDVLTLAPSWVRATYGRGFELMASRAPWLWRELYTRTDGAKTDDAPWGALAHQVLFRGFRRLLDSARWDVVVCTHFLPCQLAAGRPDSPPFALVVTDFVLHRYWGQAEVSRYFVALPSLVPEVRRRVRRARVSATGIPVGPEFTRARPRFEARTHLGLPASGPVVLVMGGGLGLGIEETVAAVLRSGVGGIQVVAVCGRNGGAAERLRGLHLPESRLRILGYTREIPDLMAAADVVVTKPGGLTCSEALAVGRPLLLTRPIPGHEEGNVEVLTAAGTALSVPTADRVAAEVRRLLHDQRLLQSMRQAAWKQGKLHAAVTVAGTVWREYALRRVA